MVASSTSVNVGSVPVGKTTTTNVSFANTSSAAVSVTKLSVTGNSFSVVAPKSLPVSVPAGGTLSVSLDFVPSSAGQATGQLNVTTSASTTPTAIALVGTGAAVANTTPALTGFTCNSASMGGTATNLCTVTISAPAVSPGFRVGLSSNDAALTSSPAALVETGNTSAQFQADSTPVTTAQTATLTASAGSVTETFAIQLTVPVPTLSVSSSSVAFGSVGENTAATQSITLSSTGTSAVTISAASVSGAGFTLTQGTFPMTLNPGQTATVGVQFDPTTVGALTGQLTLTSNSSTSSTTTVALSGTGLPQLTGITCNSASMGGTATDLCTVTLSGPAPAAGFRVGLASNNAAVTISPAALVHSGSTSAQFTASSTPVTTAQTAVLTATALNVTDTFTIQLTVPVSTLGVSSSSVAFGSVGENTAATQSITLSSTGTAAVTVSAASVSGAGFTLTQGTFPMTLNPGQTATVGVQFDPATVGALTGQLTLTSNSSTGSSTVVALSGTGLPQLTGITCSSASMGGTATDLCTVTISGPAPSPGFRVGLASNNAAVTTSTAALVQTGNTSAQFQATATPVTTAQTAVLTATALSVTDTFSIQLTVPVATLSVSSSSVVFGSEGVNSATTQSVTLSSTGTSAVTISAGTVSGAGFTLTQGTFPMTLNPGQTATVVMQFDPTAEGALTGQLTLTSNSSTGSSTVVALSGTGLPQLTGITCSSASMVGTATDLCTVTISGPAPSPGFRVGLAINNSAVTISPAALVQTGNTSAQFQASATPVTTAQTAVITATALSVTDTFSIQLNAALPVLGVSPASVAFGNVPVNLTAPRTVTLTSTGAASLTITSAAVSGTGFSMALGTFPITLTSGQSTTLSVLFSPTAMGASSGQLTIVSNSSTSGATTIALSGTGASAGSFTYNGSQLQSTLVPANPAAPIASNFFGMTIHHTDTPFPAFPVSTLRFWDAASWGTIETASGQYDWSHMDEEITSGSTNGVSDYIFTFGNVPAWASTNPTDACTGGDGAGSCDPPDMTAFSEFATQVVQRYCGTIKYYETWNEPDNTPYWNGTNAQLLSIAQQVYSIAKDPANCGCTNGVCSPNGGVNPNQVLLPPISHIGTSTLAWLGSYLAGAGAQYPYADVAAFHGYNETSPENVATDLQSLSQVLGNYGLGSLPVWNTEASWGSMTAAVGEDQASWLMRYHMVQAVAGVSRFIWYAYDDCGWGTLWEAPWCTNPQNTVSQATVPGQAYPVVQTWMSGATVPSCREYANGLWACELQRTGGYDAWMLWSSTGNSITVPIDPSGELILYRDWQNNVNSLPSSLTVDEMPVLLENQDL